MYDNQSNIGTLPTSLVNTVSRMGLTAFSSLNLSLCFIASILVLQGCVGVQSFPLAARAGDTITIAAGSVDGMTSSNTTVTFVSDATATLGDSYDLTPNIRAITKIYPDKTSNAWTASNALGIPGSSGHGSWQTVIILDLDPAIPIGAGHFDVHTTAYTGNPFTLTSISDVPLDIEILPGAGVSNTFSYKFFGNDISGTLSDLEPRKQIIVTNAANGAAPYNYGAIEIVVNAPMEDGQGVALVNDDILIVPDDQPQDPISQKQLSWSRTESDIKIYIISPVGKLGEIQARTSIVVPGDTVFTTSPTIVSATYYNVDGVVVTGPTPTVQLVQ